MDEMSLAHNYALALFKLTEDPGVVSELTTLTKMFEDKVGICAFFGESVIDDTQRTEWVKKELATFLPETQSFIRLLDEKSRISLLRKITKAYESLFFDKNNMERIFITTATVVDESYLQKIVAVFEKKTNQKLTREHIVDPTIIGGVRIQIGSQLYDDTIRTKLQKVMRTYEKEV